MAKTTGDLLDDIISAEFAEAKDLSKEDSTVKGWIDSGNYALNYICSKKFNGGYPLHHITMLAGKSGVGKSMLPMIAAKDKIFSKIIIFDTEGGGSGASLAEFVGAPKDKIRIIPIKSLDCYKVKKADNKIEGIKDSDFPSNGKTETDTYIYHMGLNLAIKKILYALEYNHTEDETLIIIDSLSNLVSSRVLAGGFDMAYTNQLLNQLFSCMDSTLEGAKTTVLIAGKVYTDVNNPYNTDGIIKGGESVIYNPSLILNLTSLQDNPEISDAELKEEKEQRKTGLGASLKTVRARVRKSRFGTEGRNAWVVLDATYGLTRTSGLFQLLCDFGVCVKNGTRYTIPGVIVDEKGEPKPFFKKNFPEIFNEDHEKYIEKLIPIMEQKEEEIKNKRMNLDINDTDEAPSDEEMTTTDILNAMEAEREVEADKLEEN